LRIRGGRRILAPDLDPDLVMDLDEVRGFLAVYEARSFSGAATTLAWPRATVRRRVESLETRVGAPLFTRTPTGAEPTPPADRLVPHAREMLGRARAMLRSVRHAGGDLQGLLHIAAPPGLPPLFVRAITATLASSAPGLQCIVTPITPPLAGRLEDVDLLVYQGHEGPGPGWMSVPAAQVRRRLVASPALLDAQGRPASPSDLDRFMIFAQGTVDARPTHLPTLDGHAIPVQLALVHPNVHLLLQMATAGACLAFVPDGELDEHAFGIGPLERVLDDLIGDVVPIHVAVPEALAEVPHVRLVFDLVRSLLGSI